MIDIKELQEVDLSRFKETLYEKRNLNVFDISLMYLASYTETTKNSYLGEDKGLFNERDEQVIYAKLPEVTQKDSDMQVFIDMKYFLSILENRKTYVDMLKLDFFNSFEELYSILYMTLGAEQENASRIQSEQGKELAKMLKKGKIKTFFDRYRAEVINLNILDECYTELKVRYARLYAFDTVIRLISEKFFMPEIKTVFNIADVIKQADERITDLNSRVDEIYNTIIRDGYEPEKILPTTKAKKLIKTELHKIDIAELQPSESYYSEVFDTFINDCLYKLDDFINQIRIEVIQNERNRKSE